MKDPEVKRVVAEFRLRAGESFARLRTRNLDTATARLHRDAEHLRDPMAEAPVLLLACIRHDEVNPPTVATSPRTLTRGGSKYAAVRNLMLAARALGLGTVPTVMRKLYEDEVKKHLGIPENVETVALIPLGYPADGVSFGPTSHRPVEEIAFLDGWETPLPQCQGSGPPQHRQLVHSGARAREPGATYVVVAPAVYFAYLPIVMPLPTDRGTQVCERIR